MNEPLVQTMGSITKNGNKRTLASNVTTWDKTSDVRLWNNASQKYESQTMQTGIYHPDKTYVWKSNVQEDGTIPTGYSTSFNYTGMNSTMWKETASFKMYNNYSKSLEIKNSINGTNASIKYGYNNSFVVGSTKNTKYSAWCFSGAEDLSSETGYYDGEVYGSNFQFATQTYAHTGKYCSKIPSGAVGFRYRVEKSDLPTKGIYRASVWIHQNGVNNARLICQGFTQPNNAGQVFIAPHTSFPSGNGHNNNRVESAGSWHLFTLDIDCASIPQNVSYLLFQVINPLTTNAAFVYADDFRVFNVSDPIIVNVYDKDKSLVMATLNEEGYATKYIYDDAGRLKYTYDETKNGFVKRSETKYNFYK